MAKIRHELNIIVATVATQSIDTGTAGGVLHGYVRLDPAQYNGTLTAYLEVVSKNGTAGTVSITLRRAGTATDDASISLAGSQTVFSRNRSTSFTPSTAYTYFIQFSSTSAFVINSAKIILLQDTSTAAITNSETQIEIGNKQQSIAAGSTAATALANPKYWYYDSAKWDGTATFYAEVTFKLNSSGPISWRLQEDNGSFASWADKVTIVSSSSATAMTRTRSATFTPTTGRNYRLVYVQGGTMTNHDAFNGKIIVVQGVSAGTTLDSYPESNQSSFAPIYFGTGGNYRVFQSFTGDGSLVYSAKFYVKLASAGSINAISRLWTHSGTFGSTSVGALPVHATSSTVAVTNTSYALVEFVYTTPYQTTNGTKYLVDIQTTSASPNLDVGLDNTSTTHEGNFVSTDNNTTTDTPDSTKDLIFYVIKGVGITKIEEQYLIANAGSYGAATGLKDYDTYYDPAEWDDGSGSITYIHQGDGAAAGTGDIKLQSDPNGSPADITGSTVTDVIEREFSSSLTMPGSAATIDVNVTGTGTLNASRILAQYTYLSGGTAALTGTVTSSTTEADIVTGGKTIILTLTGDTWVTAGATFDAQRQNIINGIDSAQAEATGWDAVVKAGLAVTTVVRTSNTVVTVTLSAFATYNITATETITVTIPSTSLTGGVAIVASPTFTVTHTASGFNSHAIMTHMRIAGGLM